MKLGGSVITDKSRYRTPRLDAIARLARELASCGDRLVVVHGAGSYGHVLAREHRLTDGDDGSGSRRLAAMRVHADVRELGQLVTRALLDAKAPAVWHSTHDIARLNLGRLTTFSWGHVLESLENGLVPVLSGDLVPDSARGFGILSGDVLMVELARALRPARAVFATDVEGIYDRDPKEPGARLLARIAATDARQAGSSPHADITGGMAGKLARARDVAKTGVPVQVVNGDVPGRVADALAGRDVVGTLVS